MVTYEEDVDGGIVFGFFGGRKARAKKLLSSRLLGLSWIKPSAGFEDSPIWWRLWLKTSDVALEQHFNAISSKCNVTNKLPAGC